MTTLLHLDSSPMGEASHSRALAARFVAGLRAEHADLDVRHRDLAADPPPHLDHDAVVSVFLPEAHRSGAQQAAWERRDALVTELLDADALLISAPMHNWTVPSTLKAWIDQVLVMGRTLVDDGVPMPLAGVPTTVVLAHGGGYTADAPLAGWDHVEPYLRTVLADALGTELETVTVSLTLCGEGDLADLAAASRAAALAAVDARAAAVAARLAGPLHRAA